MAVEFKHDQGVTIAELSGTLDKAQGEPFALQVEREVPKGAKLIVDGSNLTSLTQQGVLHLMAVQRWVGSPERKRLSLVGFNSTVWHAIVENGSDFFFDSKPTLAEAIQGLGLAAPTPSAVTPAPPAPLIAPATATPAPTPQPPSAPPRDPPMADTWPQPPLATPPPTSPYTPSPFVPARPGSSGKPFWWFSAAAVLLILVGVGAWWLFGSHVPVLTLSAPAMVAEEDGKEVDEVTVQVQHGRLLEKSWSNLPAGLFFEPPAEDSSARTYTLRGKTDPGAKSATVQLEAVSDGGQHSPPVPFTVSVTAKPMSWQLNTLQSLGLKVGARIWYQTKFIVNADAVSAKAGLPPGLVVERIPGKHKDWQLAGTPTAAGSYQVVFSATSPAGKQEEQSFPLSVAPDVAAEPPVNETQGIPSPTPAPRKIANLDDGMRLFLLNRIENLPSRYTDEDREKLRDVVGTLRQARLVHQVVFEHEGQTELSAEQSSQLKTALESSANATLLKDAACQIVVVGYASRTGSLASNVRISKLRARAVNDFLKGVVGHNADLCGDYGPTDVVDHSADDHNRAVEIYAGILEPSSDMQARAERFKQDFNRRHGIH